MEHNLDLITLKRETNTTATGDVETNVISLNNFSNVMMFLNVFAISGTNAAIKVKKIEFSKTVDFSNSQEITSYSQSATTGGNIDIAFHTSDYFTPNNPNERGATVADAFDQSELKVIGKRKFGFDPKLAISPTRGYFKATFTVSGTNPNITWNCNAICESYQNPVIPA